MNAAQWLFAHSLAITGYLLAILLIPRILLERRHPGATIAWVLAIGLVPFLGVPLYFLIGGRRIKKVSRKKDWSLPRENTDSAVPALDHLPVDSQKIACLMMQTSIFPPSLGNSIDIIDDGIEAYKTLFNMLESAKKSIEIATFILGHDEVGKTIIQLLAKKAEEGLEVRLLLDALGSMRTSGHFPDPLRNAGGKVGTFLPILPVRRRWSANLRNHRKLTVVDGYKAFVGGMNIAREYMGPRPYKKRWKDVSMVITGTGAGYIRSIFWQDWTFSTNESIAPDIVNQVPLSFQPDNSIIQVVGDGPDIPERPLYSGVLAALNRARKNIWVVTPYFVPDDALSESLALAARMGADVRLIMPEKSNHPLVDLAGHSYIDDLMQSGVHFYFYQPGMLHAKLISIDDTLAVVGSANMDIRSFQLNFEIANFLYDAKSVEKVASVIQSIIKKSRKVTFQEIAEKNKLRRFSEDICRVFSPLF